MSNKNRRPRGEGSIRNSRGRADTWEIRYTVRDEAAGTQKYKSQVFRGTEDEAKNELRRILHERDKGTLIVPNQTTVEQYLRHWLKIAKDGDRSPKVVERYQEECDRHIIPYLGSKLLHKLRPDEIQAYYNHAQKKGRRDGQGGLSAQTIRNHHAILRKAFGDAVKWGLLAKNPAEYAEPPRVWRKEAKILELEELTRLLEAAKGGLYYLPILLAVTVGGMRRGEWAALRWDDLDEKNARLYVCRSLIQTKEGLIFKTPKTMSSVRWVDVPEITMQALREHRELQNQQKEQAGECYQDQGLIFAKMDGSPFRPDNLTNNFYCLCKKLGLSGVTLHTLRHTFASHLIADGETIVEISKALGHSDTRTTLGIYAHRIQTRKTSIADRIQKLLMGSMSTASDEEKGVTEESGEDEM